MKIFASASHGAESVARVGQQPRGVCSDNLSVLVATTTAARLRELACAPQIDERDDTHSGPIRCAAATATAAAFLSGGARTMQLANAAITKRRLTRTDPRVRTLQGAFRTGQAEDLCAGHICCMQDLVFEAFGSRGEGTYPQQFATMMAAAGFWYRSCALKPRAAAEALARGEMFGLNYRTGPSSWHTVLVHKQSSGDLVVVDSGRGAQRCVVNGSEVAQYLDAPGAELFSGRVFFEPVG